MLTIIYDRDIALSNVSVIVNASNGWGYMGGQRCIDMRQHGVAESIQYVSQGAVEKLSRKVCKNTLWVLIQGAYLLQQHRI